jgi:hypothetical protein
MQEEGKGIMKRQLEEVNKFKDQNGRRKFYKAVDNLKK